MNAEIGSSSQSTVAVLAPTFPPAYLGGGPIRTLEALISQTPQDFRIFVLTSDRDLGGGPPLPVRPNCWVEGDRAFTYYMSTQRVSKLIRGYFALRRVRPEVLYINSFFDWAFSIFPQLLCRALFVNPPTLLLAPRGEFNEGALAIRSRKKALFIAIYKLLRLNRRIVWHASTELEASDVRRLWGADAEIIVHEDETSLPTRAIAPPPGGSRRLEAIFLSRIVPKKGLLLALQALESTTAEVSFDIYGAEEDVRYADQCRRAASAVPANVSVRFMGSVLPKDVRSCFNGYDVFIFPTAGENFGHVVAEALSASCPVICSAMTPWTDLLDSGAGRVVRSLNVDEWRVAIESHANLGVAERCAMRQAAGESYEQWRSAPKGQHIFVLLQKFRSNNYRIG